MRARVTDVFGKMLTDLYLRSFNIPRTYKPKWDVNVFDEPEEKGAAVNVKIQ